jgi:hypothetical protein
MSKNEKWNKFMTTSSKRSAIAFGIAVMGIGYSMLPVKPPAWLSELVGVLIMAMGAWLVTTNLNKKTP